MTPQCCCSAELPKWKCHKTVHALKIKEVRGGCFDSIRILEFEDSRYAAIQVPYEWASKHEPKAGGYYVVYDDGYKSYSPAKAFEDGYTLIS